MSLDKAAQYLASHGRGEDSMLVHMTPNEVKGLQSLAMAHGGSLSINPHTGLAEAGFLKNILPMVAGAALTAATGGAAAPWMIGLGYGAFETARTGDINKGLMAGLGAYGGAGLATGLSAAGASATPTEVGASKFTEAGQPMFENTAKSNIQSAFNLPQTSTPVPGAELPGSAAGQTVTSAIPPQGNVTAGNMFKGIGELGSSTGREAFMKAAPMGTLPATGITAAQAMTPEVKQPSTPEEEERYKTSPYRYNLASNFAGSTPVQPNPYYRPTGLGYAAQGGSTDDIMMAAGGSYDDEPRGDDQGLGFAAGGKPPKAKPTSKMNLAMMSAEDAALADLNNVRYRANMSGVNLPKASVSGLGEIPYVSGGSIGGYSDGGRMLKGPGDGMSDSIPATIGGKQPARLADGEFVVPADVVSHLGNGSTDAGAKKLYGMMDKIRKARTGKKKQAPAVKADKYMPA